METFQILSDQFSHFQHLFHRWLAIFFIISSYIFDLSSSPHTWGIHGSRQKRMDISRFIPTYVGYTPSARYQHCRLAVHPHIRGVYDLAPRNLPPVSGSSPHTWGILGVNETETQEYRFIPTYVGHTAAQFTLMQWASVHPHLRGACQDALAPLHIRHDSSPPTWGIHS